MSNKSFQDKDKPVQVRQSNIIAARGQYSPIFFSSSSFEMMILFGLLTLKGGCVKKKKEKRFR